MKIKIANKEDNTIIYSEALEEWNVYKQQNDIIDEDELGEIFLANKLIILYKLGYYEQLDNEYDKLELPNQMLPSILAIKIDRLLAENKTFESQVLLDSAERYHKFSGVKEIEFLNNLKYEINTIDDTEELKVYFDRIYRKKPEKLIRIFPKWLNDQDEINEFITKEVVLAAYKMLNKINSIDKIKSENKYNDILNLALEARIEPWGWKVKDQTRKAFSPTEKDLGEIDLDIQNRNGISFITCEAFILRDVVRVQSHIEKLITHYTHDRKAFIILVYNLSPQSEFTIKWKEYSETTIPNLSFPPGFEIVSTSIEDVSKNFENFTSIKVGKSLHGRDKTPMYHVFVNIDYVIPVLKKTTKKIRKKKR